MKETNSNAVYFLNDKFAKVFSYYKNYQIKRACPTECYKTGV